MPFQPVYYRRKLPDGIKFILILSLAMTLLFNILRGRMALLGITLPAWRLWQFFTYMFVHRGLWHFVFNMLILYFAGEVIEDVWGTKRFLYFILWAGTFAGALTVVFYSLTGRFIHVIGFSGAACALLVILWKMRPDMTVLLFFIFPMPLKSLLLLMIGLDLVGLTGVLNTGMAHITHLGGYLAGFLYLRFFSGYHSGFPDILHILRRKREERKLRKKKETENYFEDIIDPILDKIRRNGMDALSAKEKKVLKEYHERQKDAGDKS
ncbi:MAG: rhomboid family intramembrane serine protease [Fibrobacterota bacterium]